MIISKKYPYVLCGTYTCSHSHVVSKKWHFVGINLIYQYKNCQVWQLTSSRQTLGPIKLWDQWVFMLMTLTVDGCMKWSSELVIPWFLYWYSIWNFLPSSQYTSSVIDNLYSYINSTYVKCQISYTIDI